MSNGCAVSNFGEAEPIRIQEFKVVWKILAEMRWRREIFDVLACYFALIGRLAATLKGGGGKSAAGSFPHMDWRFNEFPNAGAHALYVTCVEVMGVPVTSPAQVGGKFKSKTGKNSRNIVKELEQTRRTSSPTP